MYRPHTIEHYKIYCFLSEQLFQLENFLISPLSRSALMLEDKTGEKIAFAYVDQSVREIPVPLPATVAEIETFMQYFRALQPRPQLADFNSVTHWWLNHPNPLTYQQAIGQRDDLYRHFLTHPLLSDEEVLALTAKGVVTETEYRDITLWYFNGHIPTCWLGPLGVDGTGDYYALVLDYNQPNAQRYQFYLNNEYYRYMNDLPEPPPEESS